MPEDIIRLNELLKELEELPSQGSFAVGSFHRMRKDFYDLMSTLSPLSKTKKLIGEIWELTEVGFMRREEITALAERLKEIYQMDNFLQPSKADYEIK